MTNKNYINELMIDYNLFFNQIIEELSLSPKDLKNKYSIKKENELHVDSFDLQIDASFNSQ